jgi:hypothetical protein
MTLEFLLLTCAPIVERDTPRPAPVTLATNVRS